jgi:hypothetical protein
LVIGNSGEPILLKELNIHGVAATAARQGDKVQIWTRLAMTSDERIFHRVAQNIARLIEHSAAQSRKPVSLATAHTVLVVLHKDNTADLWVDSAAVNLNILLKRGARAGEAIFENDIADVTGMDFPLVEIGQTDRIICLFREGWRFALFFDFNPDDNFDREWMRRTLARLHRTMHYRHIYDALSDEPTFKKLIAAGWFPFAEILGSEFTEFVTTCEAGFELSEPEDKLISSFDEERLTRIFNRWMLKPHLAGKEQILRAAISAFLAREPIAAIKIVLTEIEGILAEAYKAIHNRRAKLKTLLAFAVQSAEEKSGAPDTLLFPSAFAEYLRNHTFADFDPSGPAPKAGSRHAVGHGAADTHSYTMSRALQAILTLDQLALYT